MQEKEEEERKGKDAEWRNEFWKRKKSVRERDQGIEKNVGEGGREKERKEHWNALRKSTRRGSRNLSPLSLASPSPHSLSSSSSFSPSPPLNYPEVFTPVGLRQ